jgi:peptidoglycan hydrolase CwlO-like protein
MRTKATVLVALLALAGVASASAQTIEDRLTEARTRRERAALVVRELRSSIDELAVERDRVIAEVERTAAELVAAYVGEMAADTRLALAQERLGDRARAAYQLGPAAPLALLLAAQSPADLVAAHEFTAHALEADLDAIEEVELARARLEMYRARVEDERRLLGDQQQQLQALLDEMDGKLAQAKAAAREAGLVVEALEDQFRAIEAARARQAALLQYMLDSGAGIDQSALLDLLGPTGGRTCATPDGLEDTGADIVGDASWYGWDFAGQSTASGAIYDPRLFTAATRDLPLGTFLRVRYQGRCAIVLVNDRGPYGNYDRVIDLSMAAAMYLGVGVSPVVADILVPAQS